ncbi:MAG TPA: TonB-dependent receptor [Opitutaceae bacterium]|nr:TonB-dependent receptor [Opitutaceae bacterium]
MSFPPRSLRTYLLTLAASVAALAGARMSAAEPKTQMAPFKVEAEFGVDGLRIQNSNSVLNQYLLDQHGVGQLQDISGIAPNLFTSNSDSRGFGDILALRGSANSIFFSAPSVALVVDDVPSGSVSSYPSALMNIESLVVKAGPQGTEYGRNAPAGVIEIKSRVPTGVHQGRVLADYGSYNASSLQAAFDGPVNPKLGYSLGFGIADRNGYIENTLIKRSADERRSVVGRGALYWKPAADLQLRFGAQFEKISDDAVRLSSLFSPDPYTVASNVNGQTRSDRHQFSFQAKQSFDWGTLIATTSRQFWNVNPASSDLDFSPLPIARSSIVQSEKLWTQEVRLESKPGTTPLQWRGGVFYSDSTIQGDALREFAVAPSAFVPPGFVQTEATVFEIGQTNFAGYGSADFSLSKATTLKVGARVEHVDADIDRSKVASNNFRFPSPQDAPLRASRKRDYLSGSVGIVQALSDSLTVQARTATAEKPHGFSGFSGVPSLARFQPEHTWANEIGLTFGPPKGRFGGSVLAFWNRIRDYQFERTVPLSTDFVVVNASEVIARGFEAKFMWSPAERVWWDFQAGYTSATFERHRDSAGASVNGRQVPFIPKYTLRTGITVDFGRGFSGNLSYGAIGRTYYDERNTAMFAQNAYGIVNAQLRYRADGWTFTLYGQNLLEKKYYQFINPEIFAGSPGAPQRLGVQISFEY